MKWAAGLGNSISSKSRKRLFAVTFALGLLFIGFLAGWYASRHVVLSPLEIGHAGSAMTSGDAPETLCAEVLQAMRGFQEGYTRRDVSEVETFMQRFFPRGKGNLVLGTEAGEWIHGNEQIAKFIRNDWRVWGDVLLDLDASEISANGDVAWLVTPGNVSLRGSARPIRFTATLVRDDGRWMFRQVQFQWENDVPSFRELLHPSNFLRLSWR